jgi:hypothetical protein
MSSAREVPSSSDSNYLCTWCVSPCLFTTGVVAVCQCNPSGATVGRHSCDTVLPDCVAVYPLSRAIRCQLRPKALLSVDILHALRKSRTPAEQRSSCQPLAARFGQVTQTHPDSDRRFCRNRARRSLQSALPAPISQLPTAVPARRAR